MIFTDRAVEVLRNAGTDKDPDWSVGSGYLIGGRLVLTAAHNVGAGECLVRMVNGSEHPVLVRRRDEEARLDLAVLELTGKDAPDVGEGVRYAVVSQEHAELLKGCKGLGFPKFKEDSTRPRSRSGTPLRNIEQLDGEIPTAAGALARLLTFRVTARPREHPLPSGAEEFGSSPWQGISGTVVFARDEGLGERVVGVVTEHHLAEGGSALTLVPIGAISLPGVLPVEERRAWWDLLGVADPAALPELPALSSRRRPQPPAPPRGVVAREELATATLAALRDGPAPLVALAGGPGFGKSVLARLVAAAATAQAESGAGDGGERWWPGGVVWLDVGQDPDLSGLLAERLTDLTGQRAGGRSVEQLASDLGAELAARRCLLVLDDVWPSRTGRDDVVNLVLSRMDGVPRLVTTRSPALLNAEPGARRIDVEEMEPGEATALLASALSGPATENGTVKLGEFARRLGRWPLLLSLAAAHLRRWVSDGVPLDDAVRDLADRYAAKGATAFDPRYASLLEPSDPAQRDRAVAAAVEASLGLLIPDDQARYRELAVFPPGQPIPVDVIASLWEPDLDHYSTAQLLRMLADLSLLSADWRTRLVRVHDLLHDYLLPADPQRRGALHRRLLQSWGDPLALQDSYRIRWYAYHLDTAGDSDRLYALITPAWRDRVLAVTGALSDVAADTLRAAEHAARQRNLPEELRCRLIMATLTMRAGVLPDKLLVVLAQSGSLDRALGYAMLLRSYARDDVLAKIAAALAGTEPDLALATAEHIDTPYKRTEALTGIAAALARTDADRAGLVADQALATADRIDNLETRTGALARIAAALARSDADRAGRVADQALATVGRIGGPENRTLALGRATAALIGSDPDRTSQVIDQILDTADCIDDPRPMAFALTRIAAALTGTDPGRASQVIDQALAMADRLRQYDHRLDEALVNIAPALASFDPDRALATADRIGELYKRTDALTRIAPALAGTNPGLALDVADRIDDPGKRNEALTGIAAALAGTNPGLALDVADRIHGSWDKTKALKDIAAVLAATDPGLALDAAERIDDLGKRSEALASIAAVLADTDSGRASQVIDQALATAGRIDDPHSRTEALTGIAAALIGTDPVHASQVIDQALATDRSNPEAKTEALTGIAVVLAGADPDLALAVADRIDDPGKRTGVLTEIAAALAGTDPGQALDVADRIDDPWDQAEALARIADVLAGTDPGRASRVTDQALAAADRITDPLEQAVALARIADALAGTDPGRASRVTDQALAAADRIDDPL
jgi:hypothetical protein